MLLLVFTGLGVLVLENEVNLGELEQGARVGEDALKPCWWHHICQDQT